MSPKTPGQRKNIALIGGRGAGKSKISRKLGKLTRRAQFSTDVLVTYEAGGRSIADIVEAEGWVAFRDREYAVLEKLAAMNRVIIDCGGGILVEAPDGADQEERFSERKAGLLKSSCAVVYIQRDMGWLLGKASKDTNRPDLVGSYEALLNRRLAWYESTADYVLDMRHQSPGEGAQELIDHFQLD